MNMAAADQASINDGDVLAVRQLACVRSEREIFTGLGFTVAAGSVLLLRGANGCGKSSLLQILAGLLNADSGVVSSFGKSAFGADYLRGMRYVGHGNAIKEQMTAEENLLFYRRFRAWRHATPQEALQQVGLAPQARVMAGELSAGQKRKLALARLLLQPASLWLLDEPCNALDKSAQAWFVAALQRHCASGGAAVIALHDELAVAGVAVNELVLGK